MSPASAENHSEVLRGAALVSCLLTLAVVTAPGAAQDLPLPGFVEIEVHLDTVEAAPGENALLLLSVLSSEPLQALFVALDFDESALRLVSVQRFDGRGGDGVAPADALAGAVFDNLDGIAGNQTEEGFVFLQIDAGDDPDGLVPVGELTPVATLEFVVLEDAPAGLSPIVFESVGPVPPEDFQPVFDNEIVFAGPPAPEDAFDLEPANLKSGGVRIKIIGEIGFMRGDSNFDKGRDNSDPIFTLVYLFLGGDEPLCEDAADSNDDGILDVADPVYSLIRYYVEPHPFPPPNYCGGDPTSDSLTCHREISCDAFPTR